MIDDIITIGTRWYYSDKITKEEISLIRREYRKYSGKTLGNCPSCYVEAYNFLKNLKTNKMEKEKTQFGLPTGKQIQMHGLSEVITEHNITDSLAFAALKLNPKAITLFSKVPSDWKKQLASFDPLAEMRKRKDTAKALVVDDSKSEEEEEIVDPDGEDDAKHAKRLEYDAMSKLDLQQVASSMEFLENEWIKKNKKHLIDYLLEKVS